MPQQITDRKTHTDVIVDVMHERFRDGSIDTLLCHPYDAIEMAKEVCRRLHRKADVEAINETCRVALASRKRGDLKRDRY